MRAMAGQTAGPIKTKLGMGTHVDPGSVLVTWRRLAKAKNSLQRPARAERLEARRAETAGPKHLRPEDGRGPQGRDNRICHRLAKANKTPYRGPQGRDNSVRRTAEARRAETIEFGAAWRMLIKLLTEARKGRENRGPQGRDNSVRRKGTYSKYKIF